MPSAPVEPSGAYSQQHLIFRDDWPVDVFEVEDLGRAEDVLRDRTHRCRLYVAGATAIAPAT
jgi:hypothetical protein